jgi:pimeloyl-ACP methyl ester carboxylesterase
VFGTWTVIVPYMRKWIAIYSKQVWLQTAVPSWFYAMVGRRCIRRICKQRGVTLPELEPLMAKLAPRPLLMIHGSEDSYIKPAMAEALFKRARGQKEFWLVDGARHNQALHIAGDAYHRRVVDFFQKHLAQLDTEHRNGEAERRTDEENPDEDQHSQTPLEIALSSTQEAASPPR